MTEQKINAEIVVADGAGGMRPVVDLRFEEGEWPIQFDVPADDAEAWMAHFDAEIQERGWARDGISQMEATENSGTCSVRAATDNHPRRYTLFGKSRVTMLSG